MPRVLTYTEGNTEAPGLAPKKKNNRCLGEGVEVRRRPPAVACRKRYVGEPGKPQRVPVVETEWARYTAIEALKGKPGNGTRLEPEPIRVHHEPGRREPTAKLATSIGPRGVLSGIVL